MADELRASAAHVYLIQAAFSEDVAIAPTTPLQRKLFMILHSFWFNSIDLLACIGLVSLAAFEPPLWSHLPVAGTSFLSLTIAQGVLLLWMLFVFILKIVRHGSLRTAFSAGTHKHTHADTVFLILMFIDLMMAASGTSTRFLRMFRPYGILRNRFGRTTMSVLRDMLRTFFAALDMALLVAGFVLVASLVAFYLFGADDDNPFFETLAGAYIDMFVLLTTANYPDVMMPSYHRSRWAALFFVVFLLVALYLLQNFLLAVVIHINKQLQTRQFKKRVMRRRAAYQNAFHCLTTHNTPHVTLSQFELLMRKFQPTRPKHEVFLLYQAMAGASPGIKLEQFLDFDHFLKLDWRLVAPRAFLVYVPRFPQTTAMLRRTVLSLAYEWTYCTLIAVNCIYILLTAATTITVANEDVLIATENGLLAFFILDSVLKMTLLGPRRALHDPWNALDAAINFAAIVSLSIELGLGVSSVRVVLRPLRMLRLLKLRKFYRHLMIALVQVLPLIVQSFGALLVVFYAFAIVGMESFAYTVSTCDASCGPEFNTSDPLKSFYYQLNNFDTLGYSLVTLFELMVVNNWHVIMQAHAQFRGPMSQGFFVVFNITVPLIFSNVIIAYIVTAVQQALPLIQGAKRDARDPSRLSFFPTRDVTVTVELRDMRRWFSERIQRALSQQAPEAASFTFRGHQPLSQEALQWKMFESGLRSMPDMPAARFQSPVLFDSQAASASATVQQHHDDVSSIEMESDDEWVYPSVGSDRGHSRRDGGRRPLLGRHQQPSGSTGVHLLSLSSPTFGRSSMDATEQ